MAKCTNCGEELTGKFCTNCGLENPDYVAPEQKAAQEAPKSVPPRPQAAPQPNINSFNAIPTAPQTSVAGWLGWLALITLVPIIGIVITLVAAKDESVRNFTKAYLILWAIYFVLSIVLTIALVAFCLGIADSF